RRILSSATFTSTWSLPQNRYDAGVLEMREVIVAHPLADQQDNVVAIDVWILEAQRALRVGADGEAPRAGVGDVIGPLDAAARRLELHAAPRELAHGGGADEPGADPEAVRGTLNSSALFFPPGSGGQRPPRMRPSMVVHMWQMT